MYKDIKLLITDFDGVWTDNKVYTDTNGNELISCSKEDSLGLKRFKDEYPQISIYVVSSESNNVVKKRCQKLNLNFRTSVQNKFETIEEILLKEKIKPEETIFIGNDFNDLSAQKIKNLNIACPKDANKEFLLKSKFIIPRKGGNGAVRYILDKIRISKKEASQVKNKLPLFINKGKSMGERIWGEETLLTVCEGNYSLKKLFIKKGSKGGLQYHHKKDETGIVVSGKLLLRYVNLENIIQERVINAGECFRFKPNCIHQEEALEDTLIIEVSTPHANDRVRVEDLYNLPILPGLESTKINEIELIQEYP